MLPFIRAIMAPRKVTAEKRIAAAKDRVVERNPGRQARVVTKQIKGRPNAR